MKIRNPPSTFQIIRNKPKTKFLIDLYLSKVRAGFPSPADDFKDKSIDLNDHLIKDKEATFIVKVTGNSMVNAGIKSGDLLIVDRSIKPKDKKIVLAVINGEFTIKRIRIKGEKIYLAPENEEFSPIEITEAMDFEIWGVIKWVLHEE